MKLFDVCVYSETVAPQGQGPGGARHTLVTQRALHKRALNELTQTAAGCRGTRGPGWPEAEQSPGRRGPRTKPRTAGGPGCSAVRTWGCRGGVGTREAAFPNYAPTRLQGRLPGSHGRLSGKRSLCSKIRVCPDPEAPAPEDPGQLCSELVPTRRPCPPPDEALSRVVSRGERAVGAATGLPRSRGPAAHGGQAGVRGASPPVDIFVVINLPGGPDQP